MSDKALISELTWRSLEMQKAAFPDMPHFVAPDEISAMLRPTTRKTEDKIHVMSFGVITKNEKELRDFAKLCKEKRASIVSLEGRVWYWHSSTLLLVEAWRIDRKRGAAKVGGKISAEKREAESSVAITKIKDRWGMSSKMWPTHILLKEADIVYNTAVKFLGKRPIAQYNYQAKMKRAANKVKK